MKPINLENLTRIGFISRSHGFKGELICAIEHGDPEQLFKKKFIFILVDGLPVPFRIKEAKWLSGDIALMLEDVDQTLLRKLVQQNLYVEKEKSAGKSEFNWFDLTGFNAEDKKFGTMGVIQSIEEYPMQILGKCIIDGKEVLFPLNEVTVVQINEKKKTILLDLPDGLLDVYLEEGDDSPPS